MAIAVPTPPIHDLREVSLGVEYAKISRLKACLLPLIRSHSLSPVCFVHVLSIGSSPIASYCYLYLDLPVAEGRDKSTKALQYACRLLSWASTNPKTANKFAAVYRKP